MSNPPVGVPTCYRHPDRETWIRCQRCERPICPDCMNEAAVGFQCPDCVAEGRRTVRQAQAAYGGAPSRNPGATSLTLIGINAVVWVLITATGGGNSRLLDWILLRPRGLCVDGNLAYSVSRQVCESRAGAEWLPGVTDGAFWQLVTSTFTHVQPLHLGFNLLAIWVLGPQLEQVLGRVRYLAVYLLSGLAGSVAVYWLSNEYGATVGASGAVFGLIGALIVVGLKVRANVQSLFLWLGINVVLTFTVSNLSWQGHLGGLLGGSVVTAIIVLAPRTRRAQVQAAGLSAFALLLVAAIVARALVLT
ncbi:rhomboid family intramembrane serine protease [Nocardioides sp. zg-536]|uniref:Rhomboid family intramembrane serine protease n=1 Tax=Nocardioides faecalis TaxID=2803858 RepID=A0A939BY27_9ACTN|nr:rhomboid family intramembrane serine protease [Nocardioides faecalis]MBM9459913.1 rhomboid family intramembrane serine protease [Nocardioides faecalis]MBS4753223.1 rhomboid family intramembrane serine protease [Nocardioides faecalis]QVI58857.1 rhomboid family intramembrane serine protease [Nocardioides faecalis]